MWSEGGGGGGVVTVCGPDVLHWCTTDLSGMLCNIAHPLGTLFP